MDGHRGIWICDSEMRICTDTRIVQCTLDPSELSSYWAGIVLPGRGGGGGWGGGGVKSSLTVIDLNIFLTATSSPSYKPVFWF